MGHVFIKKYNWNKKDRKTLLKSIQNNYSIQSGQFYNPIYALYIYYYNTRNAHKLIDINRHNRLLCLCTCKEHKHYNSNYLATAKVMNIHNSINIKEVFIKNMPLLDPINHIMGNYQKNLTILPSNYIHNTTSKLNSMENSSYVENIFSHIASELVCNGKLPSLPIIYGSINYVMDKYRFDISDEYNDFVDEVWFHKNIGNLFDIDIYTCKSSDSDSQLSDNSSLNDSSQISSDRLSSSSSSSSCSSYNTEYDDCVCNIYNLPVQSIFIEKLDDTLDKLLFNNETNEINYGIVKSALFQINFTLLYLQKHYKFIHNDLHINNIMYTSTNKKFLYYKYNNLYFKVPTYGKIFKIIDFGRCIFSFNGKTFMNDVFSKHGEAYGQYDYPIPDINLYNNNNSNIKINYNFDMCRLITTILDDITDYNNKSVEYSELLTFLNKCVLNKDNENIYTKSPDSFKLYINITNEAINALPYELIQNKYFKKYLISKKNMPSKFYSTY